jgi:group I intron endonuclease
MIGIYKITSPSGKIYIGQAIDVEKRRVQYEKGCYKTQRRIYNSIGKHGFSNHVFVVVEECSLENLNNRERYWQDFYKVIGEGGLNCKLTKTADRKGKHSEDTKKKMSEAKIGIKWKEEDVAKRAISNTGKKRTEETKQLIRDKALGRKRSEESKEKQRKANTGKKDKLITCPHCKKVGGNSGMKHFHFDKCKNK